MIGLVGGQLPKLFFAAPLVPGKTFCFQFLKLSKTKNYPRLYHPTGLHPEAFPSNSYRGNAYPTIKASVDSSIMGSPENVAMTRISNE